MSKSIFWKHAGSLALVLALVASPSIALGQWNVGQNNAQGSGTPGGHIYDIINTTMKYLLAILGFIAIIGFVISGILYLTAAGRTEQIGQAKTAMVNSILGVIVALVGYVIVQAVDAWLRASSNTSI